jgi:hypothetical protein
MSNIRRCGEEAAEILAIVNQAAAAYRGVIPPDCWHEPYMPASELRKEIESGVEFWGFEAQGRLLGIMGIQPMRDVDLIRHAYVLPGQQRLGVGSNICVVPARVACWSVLGPPRVGRSIFIADMALHWYRTTRRRGSCALTGAFHDGK